MSNLPAATLALLRSFIPSETRTALILGTGLGGYVEGLSNKSSLKYSNIPGFPVSTVESHAGQLTVGTKNGIPILVFEGRFHYYEGYSLNEIAAPIRILKTLGFEKLLISCAAGGLNPDYKRSSLMVFSDHISLLPDNPLRGPHHPDFGDRFPDMFNTYSPSLRTKAKSWFESSGLTYHEGVYVCVPGPNLETPAEYRFLRTIGADAVGMSTVPEILVAHQAGISCFAVAAITDLCSPADVKPTSLDEIIEAAKKANETLEGLFDALL